jgi:hypothetical protein
VTPAATHYHGKPDSELAFVDFVFQKIKKMPDRISFNPKTFLVKGQCTRKRIAVPSCGTGNFQILHPSFSESLADSSSANGINRS